MPYDSPLLGGHTPGRDEGNMKLNELMELCKLTGLQAWRGISKTKQLYGKAITKLVKRVKLLEHKLKYTTKRRRTRLVISDDEEELDVEDPSKQGRRMIDEHAGVEITLDQTGGDFQTDFDAGVYNVGMITPTRASEQEKAHGQGSPDIDLGVLSAAKVLVDASRERPKTYTRRRRSTGSSGDGTASTVVGLISIAGALPQIDPKDKGKSILIEPEKPKKVRRRDIRPDQVAADAELARRLQEEELAELERLEMARATAREKQEKTDFDKALKLQRQIDEKEEATEEDVDWNVVAEQIERHKGHLEAIKRYQALKIKPVTVA
ncbi:hypothetical protein Tco_1535286 [Tanacetum coccineum]